MNAATVIRWPMRGRYTHGYPARRSGSTPCRWRLPSRTPGALLSDWRAAKAVAARVLGPASCARNARLAVCGPACAHASPMSAVNTVILRYGRAAAPSQRRRRGRRRCRSRDGRATTRNGNAACGGASLPEIAQADDVVIIDTPQLEDHAAIALSALRYADEIVIPCAPSQIEISRATPVRERSPKPRRPRTGPPARRYC